MTGSIRTACRRALLGLLAFGFITLSSPAFAAVAAVDQVQGEVLIHTASAPADQWVAITQKTDLNDGDSVKTKAGTCAIVYGEQATFQVDANSDITIRNKPETQDLSLKLGTLRAKVNKDKVTKPFNIVTPVAVAAVRGTEVDFSLNDAGQLTVDLHNGEVQVLNDGAEMTIDLAGGQKITIKYVGDVLVVGNDCGSGGAISFSAGGQSYSVGPCDTQEVVFETASGDNDPPADDPTDDNPGETTPDEGGTDGGTTDGELPPPASESGEGPLQ